MISWLCSVYECACFPKAYMQEYTALFFAEELQKMYLLEKLSLILHLGIQFLKPSIIKL